MASRRIEDCVPELQEKYHAFAAAMQAAGLDFVLTCTARSYKEQVALYAQGRRVCPASICVSDRRRPARYRQGGERS